MPADAPPGYPPSGGGSPSAKPAPTGGTRPGTTKAPSDFTEPLGTASARAATPQKPIWQHPGSNTKSPSASGDGTDSAAGGATRTSAGSETADRYVLAATSGHSESHCGNSRWCTEWLVLDRLDCYRVVYTTRPRIDQRQRLIAEEIRDWLNDGGKPGPTPTRDPRGYRR